MNPVTRSLFVLLFLFLSTLPAHGKQEELRGLMAEAADFQAEYKKAIRTQGQVEAAKQEILGKERALKNAFETLRKGTTGQDQKGKEEKSPVSRRQHNQCPQESADKKVAAACNAETARLDRLRNELLGQADGQKKYAELLQRERDKLDQVNLIWDSKKKSVNALLEVIDVAFQSWQRRYAALVFKAPPYNRLVSTQEGSSQCKNVTTSGKEAILEEAQRCLQWLWIGTLQNP
jgi:hypothetical protein